jgi:hypothetical protein
MLKYIEDSGEKGVMHTKIFNHFKSSSRYSQNVYEILQKEYGVTAIAEKDGKTTTYRLKALKPTILRDEKKKAEAPDEHDEAEPQASPVKETVIAPSTQPTAMRKGTGEFFLSNIITQQMSQRCQVLLDLIKERGGIITRQVRVLTNISHFFL